MQECLPWGIAARKNRPGHSFLLELLGKSQFGLYIYLFFSERGGFRETKLQERWVNLSWRHEKGDFQSHPCWNINRALCHGWEHLISLAAMGSGLALEIPFSEVLLCDFLGIPMAWEHVLLHGGEISARNPESHLVFQGEAVWELWELSTSFGIQPKRSSEGSAFSWLGPG